MAINDFDIELQLLLDAIYLKYHYDFRGYAQASLKRRLRTRADAVSAARRCRSLQDRVLHEPAMFPMLLGFLTVQVSDMFRDPAYFRALRDEVVPLLRTYPSLKVWVAGCSTGEEVYSLAILLREEGLLDAHADLRHRHQRRRRCEKARGRASTTSTASPASPRTIARAGGRASLSDYYTAAYGRAVFDKSLRENIVFSDHSLATDSVFAEVQLVSCRNVLIYFERALQDRAVGLFHDALCRTRLSGHRREGVAAVLGARRRASTNFAREERDLSKKRRRARMTSPHAGLVGSAAASTRW